MPSSTSTGVPEKSTSRFPSWATAFGPQIVAGLVLGVIIGLVARAMPDAADGNVNWLVGTVQTIGSSYVKAAHRCGDPAGVHRHCQLHRQPAPGRQCSSPGRTDLALVRDHRLSSL